MHSPMRSFHPQHSWRGLLAGLLLAALPVTASAHTGPAPLPETIWQTWTLDPVVALALFVALALGIHGASELWSRAGAGRGVRRWQLGAYIVGLVALAVALLSPLDALGSALLTGHMAQHLVLLVIAPPLLVLGAPDRLLLWALPPHWRRWLGGLSHRAGWRWTGRVLLNPATVFVLAVAALWSWHLPALYQLAIRHESVHIAEHLSFFLSALLFWWCVLPPLIRPVANRRRRLAVAIPLVFAIALQNGVLGALLTFSTQVWYPIYGPTVREWGMSPIEDQQLAGLLMWVPASVIYLVAALALVAALFQAEERAADRGRTRVATRLEPRGESHA